MKCQIVPNAVLKKLGDKSSVSLSEKLRNRRNRLRALVEKLVKGQAAFAADVPQALTYDGQELEEVPGELTYASGSQGDYNGPPTKEPLKATHAYAKLMMKFCEEELGLNSLDNAGGDIESTANYGKNYNNAHYDGKGMRYGNGDGEIFIPLCLDPSVNGHEALGHAWIRAFANLVYWYQPGAANESYADKMGITFEHWVKGESDPLSATWLLGDDILGPRFKNELHGKALRTFDESKAYDGDPQPSHMKNFKWMAPFDDNGGVHVNSKILNIAFRLYSQEIGGPTWKKPKQIIQKAVQEKLGQWSDFKAVAKAEITSAEELFGVGSREAEAVRKAYVKVGVIK